LQIALVLTPVVIAGYCLGLRYGPNEVAFGFSAAITLWALPHIAWGVYGTPISFGDIMKVMTKPLSSGVVAVALAAGFLFLCPHWSPFPRLLVGVSVLLGAYTGMLLYVMGQKAFYVDLLQQLLKRSSVAADPPAVILGA